MKLNKIFAFVTATGLVLSSCTERVERDPSPAFPENVAELYFPTYDERGLELDPAENVTTHTVTIARHNTSGVLTVGLTVLENTDDVFVVPASVTFQDGEEQAEFEVSFEGALDGVTYSLELTADDSQMNPYIDAGSPTYNLNITYIKWESAVGVFVDDILTSYAGADRIAWYVEYEYTQLPSGDMKVRVHNPYYVLPTDDADEYGIYPEFPYNDPVDLLGEGDYNLYIDVATDGSAVLSKTFNLGINWGYGGIYVVQFGDPGYIEEGVGLFFSRDEQTLANGDDDGLYQYAGFDLYFSLETYLANQETVEPADATVETYVGSYLLNGYDYFEKEEVSYLVNVETYDDEEYGQFYLISGIPGADEVYGYFEDGTNYMHIEAGWANLFENGGIEYDSYFLPMNSGLSVSFSKTIALVPDGKGGIELAADSWASGYALYVENPDDEEDYDFLAAITDISFAPASATVTSIASHRVVSKHSASAIHRVESVKKLKTIQHSKSKVLKHNALNRK